MSLIGRKEKASAATGRGWYVLLAVLTVYLGLHLALRLVVSRSLDTGESEVILFSQSLEWGYNVQGPLYSWGIWAFTQALGTSIFAITLLKLLIVGGTHALLYRTTRRVTHDERAAVLAAFAPLAMPTFAWHAVFYLTHTLLAALLGLAAFYTLLLLRDWGRFRDYAALGLLLGLGAMSKYNFVIFAAALLLAGLIVPSFRARLLDRRILISGIVAAAVVLPHAVWMLRHSDVLHEAMAHSMGAAREWSLAAIAQGSWKLGLNVALILSPLLALLAICFPKHLPIRRWHFSSLLPGEDHDSVRLLERFFLVLGALLLLQVVATGATRFHERWLQPLLVLAPVYLFARVVHGGLEPRRVRRFAAVLAVCAAGYLGCRAAQIWLGGLDRGVYPLQMSLDAPVAELRVAGFDRATIVAADHVIGGNLRLYFPRARVLCAAQPQYLPPPPADVPSFLVWNTLWSETPPQDLEKFLARVLPERRELSSAVGFVEVPPKIPGRRVNRLGFVRLGASVDRAGGSRPSTEEPSARPASER